MCKRFLLITLLTAVIFLQGTIDVDDSYQPPMVGWGVTKIDNIQDAVDAYPNGATILIHAGTYHSDANSVVSIVAPSTNAAEFTLKGDSPNSVIIDGEEERKCIAIAGYISGQMTQQITVNLENLTFEYGSGTNGAGISGTGYNTINVINCIIENNSATGYGGGIYSTNGGICTINELSIEESEISQNSAISGGGIYYNNTRTGVFNLTSYSNTVFEDNTATSGKGGAIYTWRNILDYSGLSFINNSVTGTGTEGKGGAIYGYCLGNTNHTNELTGCLFTDNSATTNGGAIYLEDSGGDIEITANTLYENTSTNGTGGIYFDSETDQYLDVLNSIIYDNDGQDQINNTGNGDVNISYSCIENGTTTNGNITSIPKVDVNNDCALNYYSPCIDTGSPSSTYNDTDGSRADMGWKSYEQDVYTWQYGILERSYLWKSFPKLPFALPEDENAGQNIDVDEAWESWQPIPEGLFVWYLEEGTNNEFEIGDYIQGEWDWTNNESINSLCGYKLKRDNGGGCLMFSRGLKCLDNTVMTLAEGGTGWIGYFLEDSQLVLDAFPSAVINDAILIKTMDWSISRTNTDSPWLGKPATCYINYADCVIITTVDDGHEFRWETPLRSTEPQLRPVAENFTFNDDIDYIPIYAEFDANDIPDEVAVYVNDICCGAQVVEDTISQICAYILEEEQGQEIEFAFWYEGRNSVERCKSYLVYNLETDLYESQSLITGMPGIHYEVSFKAHNDDIVPIEYNLNCYPNPFNPELTIAFNLEETQEVKLNVFNIRGQKVKSLVNEIFRPNSYNIIWNGENSSGSKVSSGVYYIRLQVGVEIVNRKVILMK